LERHEHVVVHGITFGVFVPPAHTLRDGQPLGLWVPDLPLCTIRCAQSFFVIPYWLYSIQTSFFPACLTSQDLRLNPRHQG
jgi:hypothetical protein